MGQFAASGTETSGFMSRGDSESEERSILDVSQFYLRPDDATEEVHDELAQSPWSYDVKRGREPIRLNDVEYRILRFLASRPYHAFTPRDIVRAVNTESQPVTEGTLRGHIQSLRAKLGFFADYVQTVPYIGYRFKA
jgi:DNA-binding response OmpR family regulator